MSQPAPNHAARTQQDYLRRVKAEADQLKHTAGWQLRWHHLARMVVIGGGAAVAVLASWTGAPRLLLAAAGGAAAVAEAVTQLFQFQAHAINMANTGNALERELNRFLMTAGPYREEQDFTLFVERVEEIRESADRASHAAWQASALRPTESGQQAVGGI